MAGIRGSYNAVTQPDRLIYKIINARVTSMIIELDFGCLMYTCQKFVGRIVGRQEQTEKFLLMLDNPHIFCMFCSK